MEKISAGEGLNAESAMDSEQFVKVPVKMLADPNLEPIDVVAYGILLAVDVDRDGKSRISLKRLGYRIGRGERAAERIIDRLTAAGWVETIENGNGRCRQYRLKTPATGGHGSSGKREETPATDGQGSGAKTPATYDGGPIETPAIGDGKPLPSVTKTPATGGHLPRVILDNSLERARDAREGPAKNQTTEDARRRMLEILNDAGYDAGKAEFRINWLIECFPKQLSSLVGHLAYAVSENLKDPIAYADQQTKYGALPQPVAVGKAS